MANNSKLGLAKKRKSRKQLMRNFWKKERKGSKADTAKNDTINDCASSDSNTTDSEVFISEREKCIQEKFVPNGCRIVDIGNLLSALKNINHKPYDFTIRVRSAEF
jgi:hypothetical protein